ncbi:MAG: T9SS type A sorting domain-containing protein [Candidatus Cloacimonetes bacterium]|nr:T9SS type A sorting domain-containing protein [Candidatus Cloacimonadota bacterium]
MLPLNCRSYVSIIGEYEENTILDGENISSIIWSTFGDNHLSIENLTIQNGYSNIGGGISFQTNSSPILKNVTLKNNYAVSGGAFYCLYDSNPIFDNITIKNNISDGSICRFYINCNPILINCQIFNNICTEGGSGGISLSINCNIILIDCLITENSTDDPYLGYGGGLWLGSDDSELINATICSNYASISGGGIYASHNTFITNSILYNNSINQIGLTDDSELTVAYSDIKDGEEGIGGAGTIHWLEGNIDSLPQFVGGDPLSYELTEGSPCIDAGNPDTTGLNLPPYDLAGNPRIYNGIVDMGAYEWQGNGVVDPEDKFYKKLYLFQNKPNPFSSSTTIKFISADYERIQDYELSIYNAKGQLIKTYNGKQHNFWVKTDIIWDGTDENGCEVAPGAYFYKLEYGDNAVVRKMILLSR